jgi:U4/U6 small nuclear ribonucleoprotein PRP31
MGQEKKVLAGLSHASIVPHTGILNYCDIVQSSPPFLRRKALKIIAAKVALVARIDAFQNDFSTVEGFKIRKDVEDKIEKLQEPPKARTKKALPLPEEKKRNKRGGKRVRKMKARYEVTEMRKQQNKMAFTTNEGEYGDSAMGFTSGMVGSKDTGKIRAPVKKEVHTIKKPKKMSSSSSNLSSGQTNGLSSSLVFTPVQGLELVNPNANIDKVRDANQKWFNSQTGFLSAKPV